MEAQPKEIRRYISLDGSVPVTDWLDSFRDSRTRRKIKSRLERVALGNFGDYKSIEGGVCELRIDYGPGYRIYFGLRGSTVVLLLCGGDKSSQQKDIRTAIEYWRDYNDRSNESSD